jgi:hypothetical protein
MDSPRYSACSSFSIPDPQPLFPLVVVSMQDLKKNFFDEYPALCRQISTRFEVAQTSRLWVKENPPSRAGC